MVYKNKQGADGVSSTEYEIQTDRMVNELLCNHCMPTMFHVKPATLVAVDWRRITDPKRFHEVLSYRLQAFQCALYPLNQSEVRSYLLIYDMVLLDQGLKNWAHMQFLAGFGYEFHKDVISEALLQLKKRYEAYLMGRRAFPHEIGVFLGYPLGDVEGFIQNMGKNYLLSGAWKVYVDVGAARRTFAQYQEMKYRAQRHLMLGGILEELCVNREER